MRRFTALVSPVSGGGRAPERFAVVARLLREAGAEVAVETTRGLDHAEEAAARAAERGDVVVAAGGDGLVGRVAGALAGSGAALAIAPCGRGDDAARELGIPRDPAALARTLLTAAPREIDLLEANGRLVLGSVYAGIDAAANELVNRGSRVPARVVYPYAALRSLGTWGFPAFAVQAGGGSRRMRAYTVVVANTGSYGRGLRVAPGARPDDGLLDVVVIERFRRRGFPGLLREMASGAHVRRPEVSVVRGPEATIAADAPLVAYADGEPLGPLPVRIRVRERALRVLAP